MIVETFSEHMNLKYNLLLLFVQTYQKKNEVSYMKMSRDKDQKRKESLDMEMSRDNDQKRKESVYKEMSRDNDQKMKELLYTGISNDINRRKNTKATISSSKNIL